MCGCDTEEKVGVYADGGGGTCCCGICDAPHSGGAEEIIRSDEVVGEPLQEHQYTH